MFIGVKRLILALVVLFMIAQFFRPSRSGASPGGVPF